MRSRIASRVAAPFAVALAVVPAGCSDPPSGEPAAAWFRDVTAETGIGFVHETGASGQKHFVETNGSGAAWLDYDGDGRLDLYLVQGAALPGFVPREPLHAVLLRNSGGRFEDVTERAGVGNARHGMAAAAADHDGDGDTDLYVTNYGENVLYRNEGDGTFTDVTAQAGVADGDRYHSGCAWADFDLDGDLDLWVVGYVDYRVGDGKKCGDLARGEAYLTYCHPDMYLGIDDSLYRNDGGGRFTDVTAEAGLAGTRGKGLAVAIADFDADGDPDVFVANDAEPNFLWRNDGGLRFTDVAPLVGVDFNGDGRSQSCMGSAFADVDGDLDWDLFTVNLSNEWNTLYLLERGSFRDRSHAAGIAAPSMPMVGFGTVIADFDNDGDEDIAVANGHVLDNAELVMPGTTWRQPAQLYVNDGTGRFRAAAEAELGSAFVEPQVGRGLAAADFDDDGDLDLLFTDNRGPARLMSNELGSRRSWIGFDLTGTRSNRDGIGAEVRVESRGRALLRRVRGAESYLCSHDLRILVGLGDDEGPVACEIRWPGGAVQRLEGLAARRYHAVVEP